MRCHIIRLAAAIIRVVPVDILFPSSSAIFPLIPIPSVIKHVGSISQWKETYGATSKPHHLRFTLRHFYRSALTAEDSAEYDTRRRLDWLSKEQCCNLVIGIPPVTPLFDP